MEVNLKSLQDEITKLKAKVNRLERTEAVIADVIRKNGLRDQMKQSWDCLEYLLPTQEE